MIDVVGVSVKHMSRLSYVAINGFHLKKNITIILSIDGATYFGRVITDIIQLSETKINKKMGKVLRIATRQDYHEYKKNLRDANIALDKCRNLVKKGNMKMQVLDANYTFDRDQLIFRFLADQRIDFRNLAKELAKIYKTRIELRQIGVRDKAKEIGGIGVCGRTLCCAKFLNAFNSVSINMAKNQNISLNPTKINGSCGRLLCCLKYEDEVYSCCKKCLPTVGETITLKEGTGKVISVNILEQTYKVEIPVVGIIEVEGIS